MDNAVKALLGDQAQVVARRQLRELGWDDNDVRRAVRRRDLTPLHPGVFVAHTGEPSWLQRAWGGVLLVWPAALAGRSALRADDGPGRRDSAEELIHVVVAAERNVSDRPGVCVHRSTRLDAIVRWNRSPPRVRYEEAVLDVVADRRSRQAVIDELTGGIQARRTTAVRLQHALKARPRMPDRRWLERLLGDLALGTHSVLEHGYLVNVERPHGLPRGDRQVRAAASGQRIFRDLLAGSLVIELDGRTHHDDAAAWEAAHDRDLDAAVDGLSTVRLTYGQVFDKACWTAARLGVLLRRAGWTGRATACGPECAVRQSA